LCNALLNNYRRKKSQPRRLYSPLYTIHVCIVCIQEVIVYAVYTVFFLIATIVAAVVASDDYYFAKTEAAAAAATVSILWRICDSF